MHKKSLALALCTMMLLGCGHCSPTIESIPPQECIKSSSIVDDWSGVLDIGIVKVTLVLHIQKDSNETLIATVDTLEQKVNGTSIDLVTFDGGLLKFEIKAASAKFEGLLIKNESEISGQWTQSGQSFPLAFERGKKM